MDALMTYLDVNVIIHVEKFFFNFVYLNYLIWVALMIYIGYVDEDEDKIIAYSLPMLWFCLIVGVLNTYRFVLFGFINRKNVFVFLPFFIAMEVVFMTYLVARYRWTTLGQTIEYYIIGYIEF